MEQQLDIGAYVSAVFRRLWLVIVVFLLGSLIAGAVAILLPPVYRSTAKILVQSQQIPSDMARSTITTGANERLELIKQTLMTRDNLLVVADQFGLYMGRKNLAPAQRVAMLREATEIESVALGPVWQRRRGNVTVSAFTISFTADRGGLASRVANEFVTLILEQNIRTRTERASETSDFFRLETTRLRDSMSELDERVADYKKANESALPETLTFRRTELSALKEQVFGLDRQILILEDERRSLEAALAGEETATVLFTPTKRDPTPVELELGRLQSALSQRLAVMSESHPQIRVLRSQIARLEAVIAAEAEIEPGATQTNVTQPSGDERLRRAEMTRRIVEIKSERAFLIKQRDGSTIRGEQLRASIEATPAAEAALISLTREREDLKTRYDQAVARLAEAELGEKLEVNRQAERFEVIEPAQTPQHPESPKRLLIAAGGGVFSLFAGIGLVILLEIMNATIRTTADLERRLNVRPFMVIPYIRTAAERRRRLAGWLFGVFGLVGFGAGAAYAIDRYYQPLDVVLEKVLDRTGVRGAMHAIRDRLQK